MPYTRPLQHAIQARIGEPRRFLQVISGPRQVGKTTAVRGAMAVGSPRYRYISCDDPGVHDRVWLEQQWESARQMTQGGTEALLAIDEIQKVPAWSETVKRLWDEDTRNGTPLKLVVLGSSALLLHRGLAESLAGRFELLRATHWSYAEMRDAFGWDLDTYVLFGGYPGAAPLIDEPVRWRQYVTDSLLETSIARDVLQMERIDKPALLRQMFSLASSFSGQVVSYQKLVGQLQDAGNTTTLAHYLQLLEQAGLVAGLQKYAGNVLRSRGSSPKLNVLNTALLTVQYPTEPHNLRNDLSQWGRHIESAVGAHLLNGTAGQPIQVHYWRERDKEVDFVLSTATARVAIEVKSGRRRDHVPGLDAFERAHGQCRKLLVGGDGISVTEFLRIPVEQLFAA